MNTSGEDFTHDLCFYDVMQLLFNSIFDFEFLSSITCHRRQPCVELAFYNEAKKVIKGQIWGDFVQEPSMCANPKLEVATSMCTDENFATSSTSGKIYCHYQGERSTYNSAVEICELNGMVLGHPWGLKVNCIVYLLLTFQLTFQVHSHYIIHPKGTTWRDMCQWSKRSQL